MRGARIAIPLALWLIIPNAASAQDVPGQDLPGYDTEDFLSVTTFSSVVVAPDGRHVAFVASADNFETNKRESAIWRVDLDDDAQVIGSVRLAATAASYSALRWSPGARHLAFSSAPEAGASDQLFVLDMRGGEPRQLTDSESFSEGVTAYDWLPNGSALVFAAPLPPSAEEKEEYEAFYGDVVRYADLPHHSTVDWVSVGLDGGTQRIATVGIQVAELKLAPDGNSIALLSNAPSRPERFFDSAAQQEVYLLPATGGGELQQLTNNFIREVRIQWRRDGAGLYATGLGYVHETRGRWTQAKLFSIGLDGQVENLGPSFNGEFSARYGRGSFVQLPDGTLLANGVVSTRTNIYGVDPRARRAELLTDFHGEVSNLTASSDGNLIAFALVTNESFPELYVARGVGDLMGAERVTDFNVEIASMSMPEVEAIRWPNGEGDDIEGILYWPPGQRGALGLPLVVSIHGGPWSVRTENLGPFSHGSYPALLASHGYLVLEPNYRGGSGRGDEFLHAIEGYSCSRPATDVLTGVDYLIERGWADPDRMAVKGYSYGGLMTNCLITKTNRFRAAASGAGLWNDISYFGTADNWGQTDIRYFGAVPWENLQGYWEESPISGAGNITTPTLVTIGAADRRVPTTQGFELYRALVRLGVSTELLVFPREPHGFREPAHKLTRVRAEMRWIDHYLLGKEVAVFE